MKTRALNYTETAANILIICLVLGVCAAYLIGRQTYPTSDVIRPSVGAGIPLSGEDFSTHEKTLVLALQETCHLCSESAPFYQKLEQLARNQKNIHLVVVLPVNNNPNYVAKLGLSIDDIKLVSLSTLRVGGTPTLIWVDSRGIVKKAWIGKLIPHFEEDVFRSLGLESSISACTNCSPL